MADIESSRRNLMICDGYSFERETLIAPQVLMSLLVIYVIGTKSWWLLSALPLMFLGWIACSPIFNLFEGCLPIVLTLVLVAAGLWIQNNAVTLTGLSCGASWAVASLEARVRRKPYPPAPDS